MSNVNPKYQQIVSTAKELFWKYGVKRVSIEEICREAKVSKMTFYKFFPNKKELAVALIKLTMGNSIREFRELIESDKSFTEKVHRMFMIKHEAAKDVSPEFVTDLYKNQELGLHVYMEDLRHKSIALFFEFLEDAKEKNQIRKEVNTEFILAYLDMISNMLDNPQLLSKYEKIEEYVIEAMNFLFYGIMPVKP